MKKQIILLLTTLLFCFGLKAQTVPNIDSIIKSGIPMENGIWHPDPSFFQPFTANIDTCKVFDATILGTDTFHFKRIAIHPHPSPKSTYDFVENCYLVRSTHTWLNRKRKPLLVGFYEGADIYLLSKFEK